MSEIELDDLQASIQDRTAFKNLSDYATLATAFLNFLARTKPTYIVSPSQSRYAFYQYDESHGHRITRPLNTNLFIESAPELTVAFERFQAFLGDLKRHQAAIMDYSGAQAYIASRELIRVIYTLQQISGCIGDSLENANQARKRIGQLFETLVRLVIQAVGLECEPRTIRIPIPGHSGYEMPYELDLVFSHDHVFVTSETGFIHPHEVVGSAKVTSKDRIDKIFLDKYLLTKLLGRNVPVVAIFLHDVQRARQGQSIFGVNSTFKSSHFLGYTVALNQLDGVYYVDPRPEMIANDLLREQISDFQTFLVRDIWKLSASG